MIGVIRKRKSQDDTCLFFLRQVTVSTEFVLDRSDHCGFCPGFVKCSSLSVPSCRVGEFYSLLERTVTSALATSRVSFSALTEVELVEQWSPHGGRPTTPGEGGCGRRRWHGQNVFADPFHQPPVRANHEGVGRRVVRCRHLVSAGFRMSTFRRSSIPGAAMSMA